MIYKIMSQFGEACLDAVQAVFNGHVVPMNPMEPIHSHVYHHNNIFISRTLDGGAETLKLQKGDKAARKAASRDVNCISLLHRLDMKSLKTLATVLVDYLGIRFLCQSVVPGILHGPKMQKLFFGAVDASANVAFDEDLHKEMEERFGNAFMIASRKIPSKPLTDERIAQIEALKAPLPFGIGPEARLAADNDNTAPTTAICGPVEGKGIFGADQRTYLLELTRLTPRDANWVSKSEGGTGKWEEVQEESASTNGNARSFIPASLEDDEWTMAILRHELVTSYAKMKLSQYRDEKKEVQSKEKEKGEQSEDRGQALDKPEQLATEESEDGSPEPDESRDDEEYLKSLRLNINVLLPDLRPIDDLDKEAAALLKADTERVREVSAYLWDFVLPRLTEDVKAGQDRISTPVMDGSHLTSFLHSRGINCRYLGRLAALAAIEEAKDRKALADYQSGEVKTIDGHRMPLYWLELLECEMVARSAKHVLNGYLSADREAASQQPAQTIASFLCAVVSVAEETAGDTENRLRRQMKAAGSSSPDEDAFAALTIGDSGRAPVLKRERKEIWEDIERDIGRRFRYELTIYNQSNPSSRANLIPLLRRVCQRSGIRLVAKDYAVGGKCLCSAGIGDGTLVLSYPISPLDVVGVVPLMKHAGAVNLGGSVACNSMIPPLAILLPEAAYCFEAAQQHFMMKKLGGAIELANEAMTLYQRVVETPVHPSIIRCLDFISAVLFEAKQSELAAAEASRSLALSVQLNGFDTRDAVSSHVSIIQMLLDVGDRLEAVKHLRAALYLMELLAGPRYTGLAAQYHRLGQIYSEATEYESALQCMEEATKRPVSDLFSEGIIARTLALTYNEKKQYKAALEMEKRAYHAFSAVGGQDHELTKLAMKNLQVRFVSVLGMQSGCSFLTHFSPGHSTQILTQMAVSEGTKTLAADKERMQKEAADAVASEIVAAEDEEKKRKKKKGKKKK
jgi:protein TIF31